MSGLYDEAICLEALLSATRRAAQGKRRLPEVARFCMDAEKECLELRRRLRLPRGETGTWQPGASVQIWIRDPKPRMITVIPFQDRVVHHALMRAVEVQLNRSLSFDSYACRLGKGQHKAMSRALHFARGSSHVLKGDISAFFASIPHDRLLRHLAKRIQDGRWLERLEQILEAGAVSPGCGVPIGALTSQLLANDYLGRLDHHITDQLGHGRYVRYMDDFLVFGERKIMQSLWREVERFLLEDLGLKLNLRASRILPVVKGLPFLAGLITQQGVRLRRERWNRLRLALSAQEQAYQFAPTATLRAAIGSRYAHLRGFKTVGLRRQHLAGRSGPEGTRRRWLEPGEPWRLLEEQRAERAGVEPEQEVPRQPQRQPGFSSLELDSSLLPLREERQGSDASGLRIGRQHPGIDQVPVLRSIARSNGPEA